MIDRIDEEFLLLALQPDGRWSPAVKKTLAWGLAASWLAELMVDGRLGVREGKIVARSRTPMGDPVMDWALNSIHDSRRRKPKSWVRRLARGSRERLPAVMERLRGRGHVEVGEGRPTRYPLHESSKRPELAEHLRLVMFGQRGMDDSSTALIAVLDGAGLMPDLYGALGEQCQVQAERLLQRDHRFLALRDAVASRRPRKRRKAVTVGATAGLAAWR